MKKTTIFDFVQNPQNEGINWHLNFLVDYLPLIDRMFDKVVFDLKNNKANLVDNTELVDFWNKLLSQILILVVALSINWMSEKLICRFLKDINKMIHFWKT